MKKTMFFVFLIVLVVCILSGCEWTEFYAQFSVDGYPVTYRDPNKNYDMPEKYRIKDIIVLPYIKSTSSDKKDIDYTFWIEVYTANEYPDIDSRIKIEKYQLTDENKRNLVENCITEEPLWNYNSENSVYKQKCFILNNEVLHAEDDSVYYLYIRIRIDEEYYDIKYKIDTYLPRGFVFVT